MAEFGAALGRISTAAVEFASGIAVFKSFGRGRKAHERFVDATEGFADFFSRWVRTTLVSSTAAVLVVAPAVVLLLLTVVGAVLVTQDWLTGAELVPFLLLGPAVAAPMGVVGPRIQQIRAGQAAAVRITQLLHAPTLPEPATPSCPTATTSACAGSPSPTTGAPTSCATSTSISRPARSPPWSAPPAPASPPWPRSCPASTTSPPAR